MVELEEDLLSHWAVQIVEELELESTQETVGLRLEMVLAFELEEEGE